MIQTLARVTAHLQSGHIAKNIYIFSSPFSFLFYRDISHNLFTEIIYSLQDLVLCLTFLQSPMVNQKTISQKETMLNPRQRPKSPPRLAMKSKIVILLEISYSESIGKASQLKGGTTNGGVGVKFECYR